MSTSEKAQNDLKKLKAKYNSQLSTLKELFTEWTEEDLLFTLQDADGDLELAIDRISEGHANQWGEVKTKKSKKEAAAAAAAANKVSLESSTSNTSSTTAPSYPNSFNNRSTTFNSRPSVHQKSHQRSTTAPRQKPISSTANNSVSWQTKKPSTSDFNGDSWNTTTTDSWGSGEDAWKPKEINSNSNNENTSSNAWLETPKKVTSTSSPSTKSSNTGGAKTWASLLQTKEEPVKEAEPVKEIEHKLQKVDNAWLTPATNNATESLSQWDQPIQLPVKEKEEKPQQSIVEEKAEDLAVNFDSLNLEENVPKSNNNASSSHPSVADILNSVQQQQQQPSASNTNTTTTSTTTINNSNTNDVATKQNQTIPEHTEPQSTQNVQQQALYQQQYQQQFQQPQYQQFGIQDYNNSFNANYGAYGNNDRSAYYNAQPQKFAANNKQDGGNKSEGQGQESQFPQMYNNTMQQQQSFYPYYYMPNQFNAYSPYGQHQQVANAFMNGRNNMYPTSVYGQQQSKTPTSSTNATTSATTSAAISSPYGNSSPYNPSQQLYGGFNTTSQFDDFSSSQFYGQPQFLNSQQPQQQQQEGGSPEKTNKSPHNIQQQAYGNNYFGQSPMFSYQQQQQYRSSSSSQQYWNQ